MGNSGDLSFVVRAEVHNHFSPSVKNGNAYLVIQLGMLVLMQAIAQLIFRLIFCDEVIKRKA